MKTERANMIVDNKQLCILTHGMIPPLIPTISLLCGAGSDDVNQISHHKLVNTSAIN